MRAFISVELPDEIKSNIESSLAGIKRRHPLIKWLEAKHYHLTLKFLGSLNDRMAKDLPAHLLAAVSGIGSFKVRLSGVGSFPEGKAPSVFWIGIINGGEELKNIADRLEKDLSRDGFRSEEKEFSAHLTIGRVKTKKGGEKVKEDLEGLRSRDFGSFTVSQVSIMKSTLTPKGPVYEVYKSIKLG